MQEGEDLRPSPSFSCIDRRYVIKCYATSLYIYIQRDRRAFIWKLSLLSTDKKETAMVNTDKIRLMAQAASYEEKMLRQDSFAKRYYRQDYLDKEKLKARFWSTVFFLMYWGFQIVNIFYVEHANLLTYDYVGLAIRVVVEYIVLLLVVSAIAGVVHARRFDEAKSRLDEYYDTLDQIDSYQ